LFLDIEKYLLLKAFSKVTAEVFPLTFRKRDGRKETKRKVERALSSFDKLFACFSQLGVFLS